jgi:3-oxoacyl-[acyl-carrier protein] reductase
LTAVPPDLAGKVAFITGGGTGVGAGIASAFAAAGASVVIAGRRLEPLERTAKAIANRGGLAVVKQCDVTSDQQLRDTIAGIEEEFGHLEITVANAGGPPTPGPVLSTPPDQWRQTIELNLTAAWSTARAAVPLMIASGGGHLLMIGSRAARSQDGETVGAYAAAKAGLAHLVRVLASDLRGEGIAVNEISPGMVETEGITAIAGEDPTFLTDVVREMGEWLKTPEEVGRLATYIVSLPGEGTTGQCFSLDRNR